MKVLFVQNIAGIAGSEKYFLAIMPELLKRGIDCSFLAVYRSNEKKIAQEFCSLLKKESILVHELEVRSYSSIKPVFKINNLQKIHQYDIIHTHLIYADFWSALAKKFLNSKIKIVSTLHGYQESLYIKYCLSPDKLPKTIYYFLAKFSLKTIDYIYSCSYGLKDFYEKAGIVSKNKISVIQHGFDYPLIETEMRQSAQQLVIVGRVIERKGHHFVIDCLPNLISKFPNLKLVIVGNGENENALKETVKDKKLDDFIQFEGYQTNVHKYLSNSDIVLVPSYAEGLPLVIFEAFSVKKPVIAFDTIGCNEAIKNNETGILVQPFNLDELEIEIEKLLLNKEERIRLGANGYDGLQKHFSLKRMSDETATFYLKTKFVS